MMLVKKVLVSTVNTALSKRFLIVKGVEQQFLCEAGDVVCISEAFSMALLIRKELSASVVSVETLAAVKMQQENHAEATLLW